MPLVLFAESAYWPAKRLTISTRYRRDSVELVVRCTEDVAAAMQAGSVAAVENVAGDQTWQS